MNSALVAAAAVRGHTGDNPAVGCVVARGGEIVGRGATHAPAPEGSGDHAEVVAIREAEARGIAVADCDVFVTLEPCAFQGRTPPCAELIVEKRPRRVVVALEDPHPRVNGAGIRAIREAGIEVGVGLLAEQAREGLAGWLARIPSSGGSRGPARNSEEE